MIKQVELTQRWSYIKWMSNCLKNDKDKINLDQH